MIIITLKTYWKMNKFLDSWRKRIYTYLVIKSKRLLFNRKKMNNITIKDVARRCGVSIATISRVINKSSVGVSKETAERVMKMIKKMDYQPNQMARSMVTQKTDSIGLILPDICNPFFSELARGVEDTCNKYSFSCLLCNTDGKIDKETSYIELLGGKVIGGALFTTQNTIEDNPAFSILQKRKIPFCFIERYVSRLDTVPGVYFDNFNGARLITEYLLEKNHTHIAFISGPLSTYNAQKRLEGFKYALSIKNISFNQTLFYESDYKYDGGYTAMNELFKRNAVFSAVFAANDLMALGALQSIEEHGFHVPKDYSIVGFDNIVYPKVLKPMITTIEIPAYKLGAAAASMLISHLKTGSLEQPKITFKPVLVDKGSVRKIN